MLAWTLFDQYQFPVNVVDPFYCIPPKPKAQESAMYDNALFTDYDNAEITESVLQRRQLLRRLNEAYWAHDTKLMEKHYIKNPDPPSTANEALERLKGDDWYFDVKDPDKEHFNLFDKIVWRSKDKKPRHKDYAKDSDDLTLAKQKAADDITILDPTEGLKALRKFETLH